MSKDPTPRPPTRRHVLGTGVAVGVGLVAPAWASAAAARTATPSQVLGPFLPNPWELQRFPADRDNDLVEIAGLEGRAGGLQVYVVGRVTDTGGAPVAGAMLITWQTCHRGKYLHSQDDFGEDIPADPFFQYYGRAETDAQGWYAIRTVMPRTYPSGASREWWRPPHVHFRVRKGPRTLLTTQMYFDDPVDPDNEWKHVATRDQDRLLAAVDPEARAALICTLGLAEADEALPDRLQSRGLGLHLGHEDRVWGPPRTGRFDLCVEAR